MQILAEKCEVGQKKPMSSVNSCDLEVVVLPAAALEGTLRPGLRRPGDGPGVGLSPAGLELTPVA